MPNESGCIPVYCPRCKKESDLPCGQVLLLVSYPQTITGESFVFPLCEGRITLNIDQDRKRVLEEGGADIYCRITQLEHVPHDPSNAAGLLSINHQSSSS